MLNGMANEEAIGHISYDTLSALFLRDFKTSYITSIVLV